MVTSSLEVEFTQLDACEPHGSKAKAVRHNPMFVERQSFETQIKIVGWVGRLGVRRHLLATTSPSEEFTEDSDVSSPRVI